jgi:hypothetical protein
MRLLRLHEPEKPLLALAEFLEGTDNITGSTRSSGFRFHIVNYFVEEASRGLSNRWPNALPADPLRWFATYLRARSAETEG